MRSKGYWIRKPGPAVKGTVDNFRPTIHDLVPELKNLTKEDLEEMILD